MTSAASRALNCPGIRLAALNLETYNKYNQNPAMGELYAKKTWAGKKLEILKAVNNTKCFVVRACDKIIHLIKAIFLKLATLLRITIRNKDVNDEIFLKAKADLKKLGQVSQPVQDLAKAILDIENVNDAAAANTLDQILNNTNIIRCFVETAEKAMKDECQRFEGEESSKVIEEQTDENNEINNEGTGDTIVDLEESDTENADDAAEASEASNAQGSDSVVHLHKTVDVDVDANTGAVLSSEVTESIESDGGVVTRETEIDNVNGVITQETTVETNDDTQETAKIEDVA